MILYLDIDGVLNSREFFESDRYDEPDPDKTHERFGAHLDDHAVERFNRLYHELDEPTVVLSSTWRRYIEYGELSNILQQKGFDGELDDQLPPNDWNDDKDRGDYIRSYHPAGEDGIVLDDDSVAVGNHAVRVYQTDWADGLTDEDVDALVETPEPSPTP